MGKLFTFLALAAGMGFAAERSAGGVKAAEKSWAVATVAGDEATLQRLMAGDVTYTHSNGETDTKTVFIDNLKTGARKYHQVDHESMEVRLYGNTAVLIAVAKVATSQKGATPNPVRLRFIRVWVWQQGGWQLVAHQSLRLP